MIIRNTVFDSNPWGNGGARRTAQLNEILSRHGFEDNRFVSCPELTRQELMAAGNRTGQFRVGKSVFTLPLGGEREQQIGNLVNECKQIIQHESGGKGCLLWENTRSGNCFTALGAQQAGLKIIALPHNLESLVPTQHSLLSGRLAPHYFDEELAFLAIADSVFVISREEQWLLRLHGIHASYLPYYPPGVIIDYLSDIRLKRQHNARFEDYLLLGTAENPPTLQGMNMLMSTWPQISQGRMLHVAGYKTERLKEIIPDIEAAGARITIHGTLSNEDLAELLVSVRAVILHQPPTTGALTRIPEMLLAGVPILANENAARNAYQMEGLHLYEDPADLHSILEAPDLQTPPVLPEPAEYEERFIHAVRNMSGEA